jgi:hypothetical protein
LEVGGGRPAKPYRPGIAQALGLRAEDVGDMKRVMLAVVLLVCAVVLACELSRQGSRLLADVLERRFRVWRMREEARQIIHQLHRKNEGRPVEQWSTSDKAQYYGATSSLRDWADE